MAEFASLREAVGSLVRDGDAVALEGFTHLIPFAAGHELVRQERRGLTLIRMTPDIIYDQMIGMGCAARVVFSWGGNPGVGSLHRFRDAIENGWPAPVEIEEHSHADMAASYQAGASGLPFAVMRGYVGSDLPKFNEKIQPITCPFTGEVLTATPALNPDVTIIHAQKADRRGNVAIFGIVGIQKEAVLAAKKVIVTVEEIVDDLECSRKRVHPASMGDFVHQRGAGWRASFLCPRVLQTGQFVLQGLGRHLPRSGAVSCVDETARPGHEGFCRVPPEHRIGDEGRTCLSRAIPPLKS